MTEPFRYAKGEASSRAASEDRAEVFEQPDRLVIVVADGAGGLSGGSVASDAVVAAVRARTGETPLDPYDVRAWSQLLVDVDLDLVRDRRGGETTAIIVVVGAHEVVGASAGDSEAWIVGPGIDRLTEAQSRARIGTGKAAPTTFHRRSAEGTIVVGTDGLFHHAASDAIASACSSVGDVADIATHLVALPRLRSGAYPDDVAVVIARATPDRTRRRRSGPPP